MKFAIIIILTLCSIANVNGQSTATLEKIITTDSSEFYGLVPDRPIKVGGTYNSGVANQRKYLDALRDAQGKPISYERKGSCCAYPSENGFEGYALVDRYEVKYRDANNKKQKVILYVSFYDFEELRAVKGFTFTE